MARSFFCPLKRPGRPFRERRATRLPHGAPVAADAKLRFICSGPPFELVEPVEENALFAPEYFPPRRPRPSTVPRAEPVFWRAPSPSRDSGGHSSFQPVRSPCLSVQTCLIFQAPSIPNSRHPLVGHFRCTKYGNFGGETNGKKFKAPAEQIVLAVPHQRGASRGRYVPPVSEARLHFSVDSRAFPRNRAFFFLLAQPLEQSIYAIKKLPQGFLGRMGVVESLARADRAQMF